jgi:hypothetical protein
MSVDFKRGRLRVFTTYEYVVTRLCSICVTKWVRSRAVMCHCTTNLTDRDSEFIISVQTVCNVGIRLDPAPSLKMHVGENRVKLLCYPTRQTHHSMSTTSSYVAELVARPLVTSRDY